MPDSDFDFIESGTGNDLRAAAHSRYSKMPVIRNFESLLSDDDFECVGLKIARHPAKETFYVYRPSELVLDGKNDALFAKVILPDRNVAFHNAFWLDQPAVNPSNFDATPTARRLSELRQIATEESLAFNEASADAALAWLHMVKPPAQPSIFLLNNGNIRLLWRNQQKQIGIQFRGEETAQFVFLGEDDENDRIFGTTKVADLFQRINGLDLSVILGFHPNLWTSKAAKTSFVTWADRISKAM